MFCRRGNTCTCAAQTVITISKHTLYSVHTCMYAPAGFQRILHCSLQPQIKEKLLWGLGVNKSVNMLRKFTGRALHVAWAQMKCTAQTVLDHVTTCTLYIKRASDRGAMYIFLHSLITLLSIMGYCITRQVIHIVLDLVSLGTFRFAWTDTCDVRSRQCIKRTSIVAIHIVFVQI